MFTPLVLRKLRSNKRVNAMTHGLSQISMNTFQRSMRRTSRTVGQSSKDISLMHICDMVLPKSEPTHDSNWLGKSSSPT